MNSPLSLARPELLNLSPYAHAAWDPRLVRLHANENPWRNAADPSRGGLNRYPEPQSSELVTLLAGLYGVAPEQVLVGRGSDEAIDLLVRAFCTAGHDRILVCPPTFAMYRFAADVQGAGVVEVPLHAAGGFALDAGAVLDAWTPATKIVFLCSPNNPTGNLLDATAVLRVIEGLAGRALVVVDEAYIEFASSASLVPWLAAHPHLAILRTLSKAYGLAGARCGALLASPEVIGLLRRMIPPYAVTVQTIEAVLDGLAPEQLAEAARQVAMLCEERARLQAALQPLAAILRVWPSDSNFLLVQCRDAGQLLEAAMRSGLLIRDVRRQPQLGDCLRITVGTPEQNDRLIAALGGT